MAREFLLATQDEVDVKIAEAIKSREMELASYDHEKDNFIASIALLETSLNGFTWDASNLKYKGMGRDKIILEGMKDDLSPEDVYKIADLDALENCRMGLQAVTIEIKKTERAYQTLLDALPAGEKRDAAFAAYLAKQAQ